MASPCIRCNTWIKFDLFVERARELGARRIATGHYARIKHSNGCYELHSALDGGKDQSYYLFELSQEQLAAASFPLGDLNWHPAQKAAWEAAGGGTSSGTDFGVLVANEDPDEVPTGFTLRGNYPNPFNPSTTIEFDLEVSAEVTLAVFDLVGRQVLTVPAQQVTAGARQQIHVNASSLASGLYLYRITARAATQTFTAVGRMALIK